MQNYTFVNPSNAKERLHNAGENVMFYATNPSAIPKGIRGWFDKMMAGARGRYNARMAMKGASSGSSVPPGVGTNLPVPANNGLDGVLDSVLSNTPGAASPGVMSPKMFGWNKGTGLQLMGKNVGKYVPYIAGGVSALQAAGGLSDLTENRATTDDLVNQILTSAGSNPYSNLDLTSDQQRLLRSLKRDGDAADADLGDIDLLNILKGAGMGALTGAAGGVPGIIVGAVGGGLTSGLDSVNSAQVRNQAELEALLEALTMSEMNYKNTLRQKAYANF